MLSLWWGYTDESYVIDNELLQSLERALKKYWYWILQYENCYWLQNLREKIVKWAPEFYKIPQFSTESLIITSGITAWLDLVWRNILWGKYDALIIEPCYDTAIRSIQQNSNQIFSINASDNGDGFIKITTDQWNEIRIIFSKWTVKLLYIVPNYSNPSWLSISQEDKIKLLSLCKEFSVTIFEDDPYALYDYSWKNNGIKTFYELDTNHESVIYANSFSKIGFPWLRIGFLVWNPQVIAKISEIQKYSISSPNLLTQWIVEDMIDAWIFTKVFKHRFSAMKNKYINFIATLNESEVASINQYISWINGWFYAWINVKNWTKFTDLARENGLVVIPWKIYWCNYNFEEYIRVTFSQIPSKDLEIATNKLIRTFMTI